MFLNDTDGEPSGGTQPCARSRRHSCCACKKRARAARTRQQRMECREHRRAYIEKGGSFRLAAAQKQKAQSSQPARRPGPAPNTHYQTIIRSSPTGLVKKKKNKTVAAGTFAGSCYYGFPIIGFILVSYYI